LATIDTITISSSPYDIVTPEQAAYDIGLRNKTYVYIMADHDRLDKAYPFPKPAENGKLIVESGPMFIVTNEKYTEMKARWQMKRDI
jgi:hypothetical protein